MQPLSVWLGSSLLRLSSLTLDEVHNLSLNYSCKLVKWNSGGTQCVPGPHGCHSVVLSAQKKQEAPSVTRFYPTTYSSTFLNDAN